MINKLRAALAALEESRDDVQFAMDDNEYSERLRSEVLATYYTAQLAKHDQSITDLRSVISEMESGGPVGQWTGSVMEWTFNPYKLKAGAKLYTHPQPKAEP